MSVSPVPREIAHEAAHWFLRLQAATADEQAHQDCARWRAANPEHERAWQLAARFSAHVQAIPPAIGRSTLRRPSGLSRRTALKGLTSLIVLGSLGLTLSRSDTLDSLMADASTGVGERRRLVLPDGSELHLNTDSAVDMLFTAETRTLRLRHGEVWVRTAADPRPFLLESARGEFRPLGTRFSVRQHDHRDVLQVTEGAVMATPRAARHTALRVAAGEQAALTADRVTRLPGSVKSVDWLDGVLRVDRMRLADVVAELGRYRHGWIRCAPEVAELPVSGAFQLADTDAALNALALTFPVRVRYVTRYWVTLTSS